MELGELLRNLRGDRSATAIAREIGVVKSALYLWEAGNPRARRLPSPRHLQRLLDIYGASVADRLLAWQLRAEAEAPGLDDAAEGAA